MLEILVMLSVLCVLGMVACTVVFVNLSRKQNRELVKQNINIEEKYVEVLKDNSKNQKTINRLEKTCEDLSKRVTHLEDENRKIKKTLEFYDMVAPNFKLEKPFTMKIVK